MAGQLVMKNTFWELEMSPEELESTVSQRRERAYTDTFFEYSSNRKSTDLGSFNSTTVGSPRAVGSSSGSVAGDSSGSSDRWADFCDSDDDLALQPTSSCSSGSSRPSRPQGTWFSQQSLPSRPAGTWFVPQVPAATAQTFNVNAEADELEAQAEACAKRAQELRLAAQHIQAATCDGRTTLIVKNLPAGCTHDELRRILDEVGFGEQYNFVYVPFDFKKSVVFRYGFVNFEQHEQAVKAMAILNGFSGWVVDGDKGCEVEWSGAQQSLHALIERYRNSPVMHTSVPDAYKPLLFERGVQIVFPAPTQPVNPPKHANQSAAQTPEVRSEAQADVSALRAQESRGAAQHLQVTQAAAQPAETHDSRTTLIVKNLPLGCTHNELHKILDEVGLGGMYNFIYIPFDFKKSVTLRYGFVNFEEHEQALRAMAILEGFSGWDGEKGCEVEWGGAQQSLHANIERYRNSPLMHPSVPDEYKPVLFNRGVRIAFPAPTQVVKQMKLRRVQQS